MILTSLAIPARDNTINMVFVSRFSPSLDGKHTPKEAAQAFDAARYGDPYLSNLVTEGFEYAAEDKPSPERHPGHDYSLRVFYRPFEGAKMHPDKEFPKIAFRLGWLAYRCAGHPLIVDADSFDRQDYKSFLRIGLPSTAGPDLV